MQKVTSYFMGYDETEKIRADIKSFRCADEIIVADSWSKDGTAEIAQEMGVRVIKIKFEGYGALRNKVLTECSHDRIFSLDSDERCTPEVAKEIAERINSENSLNVYFVPRRNNFMGRCIKHSGWFPNHRQPQLFRKNAVHYCLKLGMKARCLRQSNPLDTYVMQFGSALLKT